MHWVLRSHSSRVADHAHRRRRAGVVDEALAARDRARHPFVQRAAGTRGAPRSRAAENPASRPSIRPVPPSAPQAFNHSARAARQPGRAAGRFSLDLARAHPVCPTRRSKPPRAPADARPPARALLRGNPRPDAAEGGRGPAPPRHRRPRRARPHLRPRRRLRHARAAWRWRVEGLAERSPEPPRGAQGPARRRARGRRSRASSAPPASPATQLETRPDKKGDVARRRHRPPRPPRRRDRRRDRRGRRPRLPLAEVDALGRRHPALGPPAARDPLHPRPPLRH